MSDICYDKDMKDFVEYLMDPKKKYKNFEYSTRDIESFEELNTEGSHELEMSLQYESENY